MKLVSQQYRMVPVAELIPHPQNPRRGDLDAIAESVDASGFYGAVIVQESTGYVLAGNHRLKVALAQGAEKVPAIVIDVDEATATRILLADNRTNDKAGYDEQALADLLSGLSTGDDGEGNLLGTGWTMDEVGDLLAGMDAEPEHEPEPRGTGEPVISYTIVFDSEEQQVRWQGFLRWLRGAYECETIAERLDVFLVETQDARNA